MLIHASVVFAVLASGQVCAVTHQLLAMLLLHVCSGLCANASVCRVLAVQCDIGTGNS